MLAAHLARPRSAKGKPVPGLVIAHRFPGGQEGRQMSGRSFPELALAFPTQAEGFFGWLRDLACATDVLRSVEDVHGVWMAGFGTGGALAICAAAADPAVMGVAAVGAPTDFDDWASHPRRLPARARDPGIMAGGPPGGTYAQWARELPQTRAIACVEQLAPRPLLLLHGSDDEAVPVFDARVLADAHGDADLRIVEGGRHALRHDPRAVAILLGWLDRQRNQAAASRFSHPAGG